MSNPFFWLGLSILLVAISLMALLTVAVFALQELARAARSAEKLLDNLSRELPATLQDLRLTRKDLSTLTDEVSGSVQSARSVVQQVDQSLTQAKTQAKQATVTTRSLMAGANAAFRVLTQRSRRRRRRPTRRPPIASSPVGSQPRVNQPVAQQSDYDSGHDSALSETSAPLAGSEREANNATDQTAPDTLINPERKKDSSLQNR